MAPDSHPLLQTNGWLKTCHTVTLFHRHNVTLSHCHTVPLSNCPSVTLSHCPTVTLSHCHSVTLSHSTTIHFTLLSQWNAPGTHHKIVIFHATSVLHPSFFCPVSVLCPSIVGPLSVFFFIFCLMLRLPHLESLTLWTGDFWLNTVFLK